MSKKEQEAITKENDRRRGLFFNTHGKVNHLVPISTESRLKSLNGTFKNVKVSQKSDPFLRTLNPILSPGWVTHYHVTIDGKTWEFTSLPVHAYSFIRGYAAARGVE